MLLEKLFTIKFNSMLNKNKIIILEFESAKVYVADYDSAIYDDASDFFKDFNEANGTSVTENNSQWMVVDEKTGLKIEFL